MEIILPITNSPWLPYRLQETMSRIYHVSEGLQLLQFD